MCVFFLEILSFSFFELFCSRVQVVDTFPAPTQCIKKMGPVLENLYMQQAFLSVLVNPVTPYLKVYNSSPLILTRMKGCESKHVSPLDSGYRIKCGLLTIKYEIQAPLNFVAAVLMRVPITEEMQKLSV